MINQFEPLLDTADLKARFSEYFDSGGYITEYKKTAEFENKIKEFLEVKHCFMVNNGTISLSLALLAMGVGPGDEVLVPDITMIATPNAVRFIGATPVLVDVSATTLCMNLDKARDKITPKTKAIIYVTLHGRSHVDPSLIKEFCFLHNLAYISDDAQSLGSRYSNGERIGRYGDVSSFSFSMPKIITTGQGGCLVTNDDKVADKIKKLKDFGRTGGGLDIHDEFGVNCKFTELQAIVGLSQFRDIHTRIARKREMYLMYECALREVSQVTMLDMDLSYVTPWFIDIYVENREDLAKFLLDAGIKTRPIYPAIHSQKIYSFYGMDFPVATKMSSMGLWLPSSPGLTNDQLIAVCSKIKEFYA